MVKGVRCVPTYGAGGRKIMACSPIMAGWPHRFPWTESMDLRLAQVHLDRAEAHDIQAEREARYIREGSRLASPASLDHIRQLAADERAKARDVARRAAWPMRHRVILPAWMSLAVRPCPFCGYRFDGPTCPNCYGEGLKAAGATK